MAGKWKAGEQVRLKTGGPPMTVREPDGKNPDKVICDWFDHKHNAKHGSYHEDQLDRYDPEDDFLPISVG